ncbi:hypothetical protein JAAARDRAFT_43187 [Jaapia argillacea MUCL 33604]|uniref:Uncharacterized protein n=1 Tax=Jaapia argillacea MUCL 33604 TaxID=933084 RepID=A0A067QA89_9AGAM|nr:hypothetical protein JAAARDRAFT_43187 [Jaapia argillacea MUCL 33604]
MTLTNPQLNPTPGAQQPYRRFVTVVLVGEFTEELFTSPNSDLPPPHSTRAICNGETKVDQLVQSRWASHSLPMLPFLFRLPLRHGPIFSKLNFTFSNLPIICKEGRWAMDSALGDDWLILERSLANIAETLLANGEARPPSGTPIRVPTPLSMGYRDSHQNEDVARRACHNSLHAFDLLIATCSMAIAYHPTASRLRELVAEKPIYSDLLVVSPLSSFDLSSRAGVVIPSSQSDCLHWVPLLVSCRIPVWFYWGGFDRAFSPPPLNLQWLQRLVPTFDDYVAFINKRELASSLASVSTTPSGSGRLRHGLHVMCSRDRRDTTWPMVGPVEGESARSYFVRRQLRPLHLPTHGVQPAPPWIQLSLSQKRETAVYVWVNHNGAHVRRRLSSAEAEMKWCHFNDAQRLYDVSQNSWDLCDESCPDVCQDLWSGQNGVEALKKLPVALSPSTTAFAKDLCLGCTSTEGALPRLEHLMLAEVDPIRLAFDTLETAPTQLPNVRIVHIQDLILVRGTKAHETKKDLISLFIFSPASCTLPWKVALDSATSTLQCIRAEVSGATHPLAEYCVSKGIAFRTVIHLPNDFFPPPPYSGFRFVGLGYRPLRYLPTSGDYRCYEHIRHRFLCRNDHARAALLRGGIVWRLALEVIGREEVLRGPSNLVTAMGSCHRRIGDGTSYWDDNLSEGEDRIVCGVYGGGDCDSSDGPSWWPSRQCWESGPFHVGYWSPPAEVWYQYYRRKIVDGDYKLRTDAEWRASFRVGGYIVALDDSTEDACRELLQRLTGSPASS